MADRSPAAGPNARLLAAGPHPREGASGQLGNALSVSLLIHVIGCLSFLLMAAEMQRPDGIVANLFQDVPHVAWIAPDSGDGGNGHRTTAPARQLQRPGQDMVAIPARRHSEAPVTRDIINPVDVPAVPTTAGIEDVPGILTAIKPIAVAEGDGIGIGDRPGSGRGTGNGPGNGPGVGSGGIGLGDGGATAPRLIREVKPDYTAEAMRARIQGMVKLQAIVLPDGSVGDARVTRSLDATFGLDQEAVKTVKQWRFQPGTRGGRAVPVLIEIELVFTLR